jgi:hypothetical protein
MAQDEKITLDWSRLLGFDQVAREHEERPVALRDARLTKVGTKPCQIRNPVAVGSLAAFRPEHR